MADRKDELKETAAQCLALAHSTTDPHTRAALLTMAQKLYHRASKPADDYEAVQREFNDRQCCRNPRRSNSSRSSRKKPSSSANYPRRQYASSRASHSRKSPTLRRLARHSTSKASPTSGTAPTNPSTATLASMRRMR